MILLRRIVIIFLILLRHTRSAVALLHHRFLFQMIWWKNYLCLLRADWGVMFPSMWSLFLTLIFPLKWLEFHFPVHLELRKILDNLITEDWKLVVWVLEKANPSILNEIRIFFLLEKKRITKNSHIKLIIQKTINLLIISCQ